MRVVMTAIQRNSDLAQRRPRLALHLSDPGSAGRPASRLGAKARSVIYNSKVKQRTAEIWVKMVQWMPMIAGIRKKSQEQRRDRDLGCAGRRTKRTISSYELGDDPFIKHRPYMGGDRGPLIAAYSSRR